MNLIASRFLRKIVLPIFSKINPGTIHIRHHYTKDVLFLHSFRHKGYWFYGKKREVNTMLLFSKLIHNGDTVFDIGGHIGYMTLYFSQLIGATGSVYVFEPGQNNLWYLRKNVADKKNVFVVAKGVGDFDGQLDFYTENLTGQNNSFVENYHVLDENSKNSFVKPKIVSDKVEVVRIDSFIKSHSLKPNLFKIDVEGYEFEVLIGMESILDLFHPILMVEVTRNHEQLFNLLIKHDYVCYNSLLNKITSFKEMTLNTFCFYNSLPLDL
jgi:FkbM family methyltransferase